MLIILFIKLPPLELSTKNYKFVVVDSYNFLVTEL